MADHVAERAGYLAALHPGDPERDAALAHARACAPCARALEEAETALGALDAAFEVEAPDPRVLDQVRAAVLAQPWERRVRPLAPALFGALTVACAGLLALARHPSHELREWLVAGALAACAALSLAVSERLPRLAAIVSMTVSAAAIALIGAPGQMDIPLGVHCALTELALAALALFALGWAARAGGPTGRFTSAAVASGGALAGQAVLHITCAAHRSSPHLWLFHFGALALALALGGSLGPLLQKKTIDPA